MLCNPFLQSPYRPPLPARLSFSSLFSSSFISRFICINCSWICCCIAMTVIMFGDSMAKLSSLLWMVKFSLSDRWFRLLRTTGLERSFMVLHDPEMGLTWLDVALRKFLRFLAKENRPPLVLRGFRIRLPELLVLGGRLSDTESIHMH